MFFAIAFCVAHGVFSMALKSQSPSALHAQSQHDKRKCENVHSTDWLMSIFVNELAPPHVRSQQGQYVQQCRRIMKNISNCERMLGCPSPSRSELGQTLFPLCGDCYTSSTMSLLPSQHYRYPFTHLDEEE